MRVVGGAVPLTDESEQFADDAVPKFSERPALLTTASAPIGAHGPPAIWFAAFWADAAASEYEAVALDFGDVEVGRTPVRKRDATTSTTTAAEIAMIHRRER